MTTRADFPFFHPFRVRYSEIDGQAVVYNAHYLTYYDTAIFEYYRAIGYDQFRESKELLEDWHVVKALVEYKAPLTYDLEFEVGVRVAKMGNSSPPTRWRSFPRARKLCWRLVRWCRSTPTSVRTNRCRSPSACGPCTALSSPTSARPCRISARTA